MGVNGATFLEAFRFFHFFMLLREARAAETPAKVAEFLKIENFLAETTERADKWHELFRLGFKFLLNVRTQQVLGKPSRGDLQANLGEFVGSFGKIIGEGFLGEMGFEDRFLFETPIIVAAAGLEVGDIALSDRDAVFIERTNDVLIGNPVAKHAADHVTLEFGKSGNSAVTTGYSFGGPEVTVSGFCAGQDRYLRSGICDWRW